jgi:hypothetical protein
MHTTLDDTIGDEIVDTNTDAGTTNVPAVNASPPPTKLVDPFAYYAAIEGGFDGDYVKLDQKLGWIRGQEKKPIGVTEIFVAAVHDAEHGWIKFARSEGESIERRIAPLWKCPILPACHVCGRTADEHNDKRCDWRPAVYLPLRSGTDPDDVKLMFTGTGKGARKFLAQLCRVYGRPGADRQGKSPSLTLSSRSFPNESGGTTVWPVFKLIGWEFFEPGIPAPPVQPIPVPIAPPPAAQTALPKPAATKPNGDLNDEIPF